MSFILGVVTIFGLILLMHGLYSAYEHSLLPAISTASGGASLRVDERPPLPIDVAVETLCGTLLLIFSIVFNSSPLRPIQWAEWAGKIEREGWDPNAIYGIDVTGKGGRGGKGNPYRSLEERRGFWDVRAARKDFADWVREGGKAPGKTS